MNLLFMYVIFHLFCGFVSHGYLLGDFFYVIRKECNVTDLKPEVIRFGRSRIIPIAYGFGPIALATTIWVLIESSCPRRFQLW